jgi:eukaryotic-like serine/threonine-protein kinase
MDSARWQQIQDVFHHATGLSRQEQETFLQTRCGADHELFSAVRSMLVQDAAQDSLLDHNLGDLANKTVLSASLLTNEFGPYRIRRPLGEGGMGVVYLAERKDLGTLVAIKVLRDAWLSPARRDRFASEQRTLGHLNHPSIARLYDAATLADGTPYFVMEYVEGVPLTQFCREHKCSIEQRLHLFRLVCEAVQHAHANAIIHRDLKPSNIFVKDDGSIRLLDFGIAKQVESFDLKVDQTMTGLRLMTPAYAAPEQIRGDRIGIGTDVYSLGVILYELLTDELPFDLSGLTPVEAASIIAEHEPGRPSAAVRRKMLSDSPALNQNTWADLDVLCLTAMHKDPDRRYRSVEALIRDVDHYLNGEPLEARPDTLQYRSAKFMRRNRSAVATAAIVFAVIVAMAAFFTVRLQKARDAALAEAARTQRIQDFMTNLFQGGDATVGPSDSLRVVTMVDRGVQQAKSLTRDPKVQSDLYLSLGDIYDKLGKFDQAESLLRSALDSRQKIFGKGTPEAAEAMVALSQVRSDQGQLDDAEKLARQALDMERNQLHEDDPAIAKALLAYGRVLGQKGNYAIAIQVLDEAVKIESAPGIAPTDFSSALSALAAAQYSAGHYDIAKSLYNRLLAMHRSMFGEKHPLVAEDLESLGSIQQDLGFYPEAEQLQRQALEIDWSYYGTDHPTTALDMTTLGRSLQYEKKYDEADAVLHQALDIQERVLGPKHSSVADTLNELGNVAEMRDQLDDAEGYFKRVVDIYRAIYGDHHYYVAIAISNIGSVNMDRKDYPRAEEIFRDVIRRFTEALGADNVNTGIARLRLGRTLLREGRPKDAQPETLAGYQILVKQTSNANSFIHSARKDLAAEYGALNEPQEASRFRAELEQMDRAAAQHK